MCIRDSGEIIQVQPDVIFTPAAYHKMIEGVLNLIDTDGAVTVKSLRDRFNTSRKYAIGLLEHLDSINLTKRVGDERIRK
jgi:selenocysteine-specific elongation factor